MPDILLIQPPIHDFYLTPKRTMPYGLAVIAGALRQRGFSVELLDALATYKSRVIPWPGELEYLRPFYGRPDRSPLALFHHFRAFGYSLEHIALKAKASGAFLVGISSLFSAYSDAVHATCATVRKALPHTAIVLGGHHPTALPEAAMSHPAVDYLLRGDGEVGLPLLAEALRDNQSLDDIPGLVRRNTHGGLIISPPAFARDIEDLPIPAFDLVDRRYYRRAAGHCLTLSATRGCPMRCTYCAVNSAGDHTFRYRSVGAVMAEIDAAERNGAVGFIDFEDEHLITDKRWFMELLRALSARYRDRTVELRAMNGLYAPSLDEEIVYQMGLAGFRSLNLALITTHPDQLRRFRRPDIQSDYERVLTLAERYGLDAVTYLIVAGPEQNPFDGVEDLLFLAGRRTLAGVSIFYPAPGSHDYRWCGDNGLLPPDLVALRATALPLSHRTDRTQAVTLLRLGRILNFMKALIDAGQSIPQPAAPPRRLPPDSSRQRMGETIVAAFLKDGEIRGVDEDGEVYLHVVDRTLTHRFSKGLERIKLRGVKI
jgi:hypothetical protein